MLEPISVLSVDQQKPPTPEIFPDVTLMMKRKVGRPKKNVSEEQHYHLVVEMQQNSQNEKVEKKKKVGRPKQRGKKKEWDWEDRKKKVKYARSKSKPMNQCELCDKEFNTPALLRRHMFVHNNERLFTCDICDKKYSQINNLRRHMATHFNNIEYKCSQCLATFSQKINLKSHIKKIHPDNEDLSSDLFCCEFCNAKYRQKQHLHIHQLKLHLNNKEPEKLSDTLDDVMDNLKRMSEQMSGEQMSGEQNILAKAMMPGDVTSNPPIMNVRKLKVTEIGDKLWLHCSKCPRSFLTITSLQRHLTIHSNVRPHKCSLCINAYRLPSALREHMKVHHCVKFKGNTNEIEEKVELSNEDNATSLQCGEFTPNIKIRLLKRKATQSTHKKKPRKLPNTFEHSSDIFNQWAGSTETLEMTDPKKVGFSMPDLSDSTDAADCNETVEVESVSNLQKNIDNSKQCNKNKQPTNSLDTEFTYDSQPPDTPASSVLNSFMNGDDNTMNSIGGQTLFSESTCNTIRNAYLSNVTDMTAEIGSGDILNTDEPNILTVEQVESFINTEATQDKNNQTLDLISDGLMGSSSVPNHISLTEAANSPCQTVNNSDVNHIIEHPYICVTSDETSTNGLPAIDLVNVINPNVLPDAPVIHIGQTLISTTNELEKESIIDNTAIEEGDISDMSLDRMITSVLDTGPELIPPMSFPYGFNVSEADLHAGSITLYSVPDSEIFTADTPEPARAENFVLPNQDISSVTTATEDHNFESEGVISRNISSEQILTADTSDMDFVNLDSALENIVEQTFVPNADNEIQKIGEIIEELVNEAGSSAGIGISELPAGSEPTQAGQAFDVDEFIMDSYVENRNALVDLIQPRSSWKCWSRAPRRRHACPHCPASFGRPSDLARHVQGVHAGLRAHACPHCHRAFSLLSALRLHVDTQHPSLLPAAQHISCHICGKKMKYKNNLHVHLRLHQNKPFECRDPGCGRAFQTKANRDKHMLRHYYREPGRASLPDMLSDLGVDVVENTSAPSPEQTSQALPEPSVVGGQEEAVDSSQMPPPFRPFKVYMCRNCKKVFRYKKLALHHICPDKYYRPHACLVTGCRATFTKNKSLLRHARKHTNTHHTHKQHSSAAT